METLVIDVLRTPEVQRLRRIRQLGLAHLVFPGAEHSRLVHSLGVAWLAIRFARQLVDSTRGVLIDFLRPSPGAIRDLAVAALCHDLGHGPLSHAWEREVIGEPFDFEAWLTTLGLSAYREVVKGAKWHELVTASLLVWPDGQLHGLLEQNEEGTSDRVLHLLRGQYYLAYLPRILDSDVDVDRADFLRRDTRQTGVAYGRYDLDWLISTLTVGKTDQGELVVGFDRKSIRVIEQFLVARQALYETVYYHKTVHSAEGMVALFLRRARDVVREGGKLDASGLLTPYTRLMQGEALEPQELLGLDDYSLNVLIDVLAKARGVDSTVVDLGKRILARDLFKLVPARSEDVEELLAKPDGYQRIYDSIKPFCKGDPKYYLVVDRGKFSMLSETPSSQTYTIDDQGLARPIREHQVLGTFARKQTRFTRLFTISSAVEAVGKLL